MKLVSKTVLGLALALGSVSMIAAFPAQAQKKGKDEKEAKGPSLKLSKEFRAAMGPVDAKLKANDFAGVLAALPAVEPTATAPDEKFALNQYRLQAASKVNDPKAQLQALEGMLATGLVPAPEAARYQFFVGKFAYDGGDYAKAEASLNAAAAAGYASTDLYLTQSQLYSKQNKNLQSANALEKAIASEKAAGKAVPADWYSFGVSQAYKSKAPAEISKWSTMQLKAYPTADNWRTALVLYRDTQNLGGKVEIDLFRLMRASSALSGEKDHYDYADVANRQGLPGEAKAAIDLLKAKGPVTNRSINELYTEVSGKIAGDKAGLAAEEKRAGSAANGVAAAGTANAFLGYGEYAKAAALYQTALSKGGVDADEVNMRLGIALGLGGQVADAKKALANVKGPRAGLAEFWTAWLDGKGA